METNEEQIKRLEAELTELQKDFNFKPISDAELFNFVAETRADIKAIIHYLIILMRNQRNSTSEVEEERFNVIQKGYLIEFLKVRISKMKSEGHNPPPKN